MRFRAADDCHRRGVEAERTDAELTRKGIVARSATATTEDDGGRRPPHTADRRSDGYHGNRRLPSVLFLVGEENGEDFLVRGAGIDDVEGVIAVLFHAVAIVKHHG